METLLSFLAYGAQAGALAILAYGAALALNVDAKLVQHLRTAYSRRNFGLTGGHAAAA